MANQTRLGGALFGMVVAAGLVAIVGLAGLVFAFEQLQAIGGGYMIAVIFMMAWSLVFLIMTAMRAPATPLVASVGLLLWVAYRFCVAILTGGWPVVVDLLAEAVLAAGFTGYMVGGGLPNAYYRRGP